MSLGSSNNVLRIFVMMITIFASVISFGKIIVSHESGFYDKDITITISSDSGGKIYYTVDGSVPTVGTANTFLYSNALLIQKSSDNTLMYIPSSPSDWKKPEAGIPKATVLRIIELIAQTCSMRKRASTSQESSLIHLTLIGQVTINNEETIGKEAE